MQISFKTVIPWSMFSVYRRFEELLPLRYPLPNWNQPYPIAYQAVGVGRCCFASRADLEAVGAIDDTYRPDLLGEERYGFTMMTITLYAPEHLPLGTVQLAVPEGADGWTEIVAAPNAELPASYYECWWFIVEVVETFARQLRLAAERARQNQAVVAPSRRSTDDAPPASISSSSEHEQTSTTPAASVRRPKKGGRPRSPIDDWAWEQVHVLGRRKAVVYAEWQRRNAESKRSLTDPERSFKHAIALQRWHPHDIWAWEQVHLEQRSVAEVFAEWQHRNQQAERLVADPERIFAFVTARDRPLGMESTRSK